MSNNYESSLEGRSVAQFENPSEGLRHREGNIANGGPVIAAIAMRACAWTARRILRVGFLANIIFSSMISASGAQTPSSPEFLDHCYRELAANGRLSPDCTRSTRTTRPVSNRHKELWAREFEARNILDKCLKKEIELDPRQKHSSVEEAVDAAIQTCASLLKSYAIAYCVAMGSDENKCQQPDRRDLGIKARHQDLVEEWVPFLLKRRAERQADGPTHIYNYASRFVYAVLAESQGGRIIKQGSAVAMGERLLATNCHVIDGASQITIRSKYKRITVRRTLGLGDKKIDRCVLYADEDLPAFTYIRDWRSVKEGERVYAIGMPQGFALDMAASLSDGIVSGKRTDGKHRFVQTTAPISQGSSGGGLFDSSGRLVAITTFSLTHGQNLNFAIAAEDWRPHMQC